MLLCHVKDDKLCLNISLFFKVKTALYIKYNFRISISKDRSPINTLYCDLVTNNRSSENKCNSTAPHPSSSYCLRQWNDTNSLENEQLCVLIDHTTSSTQLVLCVASSHVHQKFAHTTTAREGCFLQGHKYWVGICRTDNQSIWSAALTFWHEVTNYFGRKSAT